MPKQDNKDNIYSMKCVICGTPLVMGELVKGHKSGNIPQVGGYNNPDSLSHKGLKCPNGHEYSLSDISGTIQYKDIKIERDVLELVNQEVRDLNLKEIILNRNTKTYAVTYGLVTRVKADWRKITRKPSPANKVLDNVKVYICSKVKSNDSKDKNIVLALVPNRIDVIKFEYNIIWYDI